MNTETFTQQTPDGLYLIGTSNGDTKTKDAEARRDAAEKRKLIGMEAAALADGKAAMVDAAKLAMIDALLRSSNGTATIDEATDDLWAKFLDGGKWRGTVTRSLAMARIIRKDSVVKSERPSRHGGYVTRWQLIDRQKALQLKAAIQQREGPADAAAGPSF